MTLIDITRGHVVMFLLTAALSFSVISLPSHGALSGEGPAVPTPAFLQPDHPNVVVIAVDALRADHLPCYGYQRNTAPALCRLGNRSLLFENAYAQAAWSLPSYATLFTGTYPPRHNVTTSFDSIPTDMTLLAEALRAEGYTTAGWIDAGYLRAVWGFDRGFQQYQDASRLRGIGNTARIVEQASQYVRNTPEPFFLFLHTMDVHAPYNPKNRTALQRWDPGYDGPFNTSNDRLGDARTYNQNISAEDLEHVIASYDASIRHTDHYLDRLFTTLKREGRWNNTIIIVTADHGEAFQDHSERVGHTSALYEEYIHVPLIIHHPGVTAQRVETNTGLVDVMPTVFKRIGITPQLSHTMQGKPLLPLESHRETPVYSSTYGPENTIEKHAVINRSMKLIWNPKQDGEAEPAIFELYNLTADPGERNDISAERPETVASLHNAIMAVLSNASEVDGKTADVPGAVTDRLRDLGYLQ